MLTMAQLLLDEFIPYRLSITSNLVSDAIARTYASLFGLTIPEWRVIAVVAEEGGVTQASIGQRTRMDKVTVSRAAIGLAGRGLLTRGAHADRRSRGLTLSAAGQELYAAVAPKALELERRIFDEFDRAELAQFVAMLRRIEAVTLSLE
jgi:DNA-binding MarR family transcriptional regulator